MTTNKMWGGRFETGPAAIMREITPSIDFDKRMAAEDLAGSKAHVRMLASEGIVPKEDAGAILQGLDEARRFLAGDEVPGLRYHPAPEENVRAIRQNTGLTQVAFARQIGVPVATLRNWEQGRRYPVGPARVLLALLAKDPQIVTRTLARAA